MKSVDSKTCGSVTSRTESSRSRTWKTFRTGGSGGGSSSKSGSSGTGRTSNSSGGNSNTKINKRNIGFGRIILLIVLLTSAAVLGYASYAIMESAETRLAKYRFVAIAQRAEANAKWVLAQKKQATDALAKMYGTANPDADKWPFVYMDGYTDIAESLKLITKGSLSFCPILNEVGGELQQEFEDYYYNLYDKWGFPNGTGVSMFGKGLFGYGSGEFGNETWPDYRYPVVNNWTKHGIDINDISVPFVQSDYGHHSALMLDVAFEENRAEAIQTIIECSDRRIAENDYDGDIDCSSITNMLWTPTNAAEVAAGPGGIIFSPIYPRNDNLTLTGFILHKQIWHDLLEHAFEFDVTGIRIILRTDSSREHTYDVIDGEVYYAGNRTHMCQKVQSIDEVNGENGYSSKADDNVECTPDDPWVPFDDLMYLESDEIDYYRRLNLSLTEDTFGNDTVKYYMDIYATEEFTNHFGRILGETSNSNDLDISIPIIACIGTVLIMLFTSILFISYDSCVRKEFDSKERLLEAKRRFVRYVSHEVRTPLNTVCMGLTLVLNDLSDVLDNKIGNDGVDGKKKRQTSSNSSKSFNGDHSDNTSPSSTSFSTRNTEDVVVLKRKYVEEWMSLSTQVYQNADAAVGVLSDLLNYDKIQMGTLTLELSFMNIWTALEKTVKEFKLTAIEKNVNLKLDFTPLLLYVCEAAAAAKTTTTANGKNNNNTTKKLSDSSLKRIGESIAMMESDLAAADLPIDIRNYKVVGDKIRLIQVFRNLISNGLKFSKGHSNMTVRVSLKDTIPERRQKLQTISLHKDNTAKVTKIGLVSIEVIDDGVGMTPDQVATVFDDGTQFDANKFQAGGGSGLGLNIARGIVLEHGATLTCSSKGIGKGSIFTLSTAIYTDSSSTSQEETERYSSTLQYTADRISNGMPVKDHICDLENPIEATEFEIPNLHVLVVDDSVTNRKLCMRLLERNGHKTEGASDGQEAVNMVKKSLEIGDYYDCILLDYEMPVMNGPDACRKIREMGCSSYIAGVTGNVMSEDVDHFRQCGANWVLPKPFQLKALEDQWVEDGIEAFTKAEKSGNGMVRVESSPTLIEMGDNLAQTLELKSSSSYPSPPSDSSV